MLWHNGDAIGTGAGLEHCPRLEGLCIHPDEACRSAVGDQYDAIIGYDACGLWKAWQICNVSGGIVINHINAVAARMCHENAPSLRIEGTVIERAAIGAGDRNGANALQCHG
jgi:hypothetical protein